MSGIEAEVVQAEMVGGDAPQAILKPTVEVVFDTVRSSEGSTTDPEAQGRIARGIAALQRAGGGVGKVPAALPEASGTPAKAESGSKGLGVTVVDPEKVADGAEAPAEGVETTEIDAAAKLESAGSPEMEQLRADYALAQAKIESLQGGFVDDNARTEWIEKPVDWMRGQVAKYLGVKADSDAVDKALSHFQWELTLDRMGVAKEALPKDIQDRNNTEHAERRRALTKAAGDAQGAAKTQAEGRSAVHKLVIDQLAASADTFPHAVAGADLNLGGVPAPEAAIYLWGEAVRRGEVKNTGDDAKDIPEALRLYDKFCKTRLGTKFQLQNATPSPAITPAASKEAAPGRAGKSPPTLSQKDAAAAPAAKKIEQVPMGPETIDASDNDGRRRRVRAIANKHFAGK